MRDQIGNLPSLVALAHELKAPLGLIRHLALSRDYCTEQERLTALRRIELAAERSLRLMEAISMTSRPLEFAGEPINLNCLCEHIAHELAPLCREKNQAIELNLPRQPLLAVGDRQLLSSVIFGLCDNAFSYGSKDKPIMLRTSRRANRARITVTDHGPGLDKKQLAEIAGRLGNAPQVVSNRPGSSGLGLYIADQFAKVMQGELGTKQSRNGEQSFYVDLPHSSQLSLLSL